MRRPYGDIAALTATVQPITSLSDGDRTTVFFAAVPGIPVELEFETAETVSGATSRSTPSGPRWFPDVDPGVECVIRVGRTTLVILDDRSSRTVWRASIDGVPTVVLFDGGLVEQDGRVVLDRWTATTEVLALPAVDGRGDDTVGPFQRITLPAWAPRHPRKSATIRAEAAPAPIRRGGSADRLSAPTDADFENAAIFEIVPALPAIADGSHVLSIEWTGDAARAEIGGVLVSDQFWSGRSWEIELDSWRDELSAAPLRLRILPWDGEADVFVDARVRSRRRPSAATVDSVELIIADRLPL